MKYILTEEQYLKAMDKIFKSLFNPIKYKTIKGHIHVFVGDKLKQRMSLYRGNSKRTEIMLFTRFPNSEEGSLYIDPKVYNEIIKVVPILEKNKLMIVFFTNWFETKFGVRPKTVYFGSRQIMDNLS
jgi:hypothetical protein